MIPLGDPQVDEQTAERVSKLLTSGTLSTGRVVGEFESAIASFADREHAAAVASGSVALELALRTVFDPGDRVAFSPYNCGAVLYSVLRTDLEPAFVDAEPTACGIDPSALAALDGVVVTYLFGQSARVAELLSVAAERDAAVVEDFAQAPGATLCGRSTGDSERWVSVASVQRKTPRRPRAVSW